MRKRRGLEALVLGDNSINSFHREAIGYLVLAARELDWHEEQIKELGNHMHEVINNRMTDEAVQAYRSIFETNNLTD